MKEERDGKEREKETVRSAEGLRIDRGTSSRTK